ncbi:hypothetical protein CWI39_0863p0010 [Hamiltosporidium magnivora]|uniref:Uncharacterized protein n=1 Tax=Hamiltosporidium magnivora TaxID=148818 RepID=A0A4Q9L9S3_9MICR|nr:hypothetical protein CWI39_0863p0010 [Hamiltosporidium magnivora]
MKIFKSRKLILSITLASVLSFGLFIFISIYSGRKMKSQLLKEFREFEESPLGKLLKNQYRENNNFGIANIKYWNINNLGLCYSYHIVDKIFDTNSEIFKIANQRGNGIVNMQADKRITFIENIKNWNLINFIHKLENLIKELQNNIENFGILNATFNHSLVDINLAKPNNKNFDNFKSIKISLNNNDLKAFFIFLFHKANIFDKKNIYGSLLKNIFPDNVLKQMLINILNFYVKMADEIKDFLSSYIHKIEECKEKLSKIKQRVEKDESLDLVQKELESLVFWYIKTILYILIDQKDAILN